MSAPALTGFRHSLALYYEMSRPRVMLLVLFTGLPALVMGQHQMPGLALACWVILGTALSGASCSVLNAYLERDIDARMARTRSRPLPAAALVPRQALGFGMVLAVVSTAILHWCGGFLAAAVGAVSILFYVFVYTLGLKRRTPQNIVIGGAAGATAPLIADAAVDGHLGLAGLVLFAIIFLWTPPHFWAVALFRKDEYAAAEIPMMPLVVGDQGTRWRSLGYTLLMVPVTLILPWLGYVHLPYTVIAIAAGAWFTWWNIKAIRARDYAVDRRMFHVSIAYLFALFGAMMLDLLLYQVLRVL